MYCIKLKATISEIMCIERQKKLAPYTKAVAYHECQDCSQGKEIAATWADRTMNKTCPGCGKEKPAGQFYHDISRKDKLSVYCQECTNEKKHVSQNETPGTLAPPPPPDPPAPPPSLSIAEIPEKFKKCPQCKTDKPFSEFHKQTGARDGLQSICKSCRREFDKIRHHGRSPAPDVKDTKICRVCGIEKPVSEFHRNSSRTDGVQNECRQCRQIMDQKRRIRGGSRPADPPRPAEGAIAPVTGEAGHTMTIDFSGYREILASITEAAKRDVRTPQQQIIFMLKTHPLHTEGTP